MTVTAGETATVEVANEPEPVENGSVEITTTDENDELSNAGPASGLTGPSKSHQSATTPKVTPAMDAGVILIEDVAAGDYTVTQATAPTGYQAAAPTSVTVRRVKPPR